MRNSKMRSRLVILMLVLSACTVAPQTTTVVKPSVTPIYLITLTPTPTLPPTITPTPVPPTTTPTPVPKTSILYAEDFEDGVVSGWTAEESTWTIMQEENDNHYWQGIGNVEYAHANYDRSKRWTDFAFEARVRFTTAGDKAISMIVRSSPAGDYLVGLTADGYIQMARADASGYNVLKEGNYPFGTMQWHLTRVEIVGDSLRLYVDNRLVTAVNDSTIKSGSIGTMLYGGDPIDMDDIRIWSLTP